MDHLRASERAESIEPFEVMDVVARARRRDTRAREDPTIRPTLHLEVGEPDAATPSAVLSAAAQALGGHLGYTDTCGMAELRSAISAFHDPRGAPGLPSERIVVTSGASGGCVLAFSAIGDPGDTLVVFEPGYPCYANIATALAMRPLRVHLDASTGYVPTLAVLDAALAEHDTPSHVAGVVVASPSNPTGTVIDHQRIDELADWCADRGATLVVDEIYHGTAEGPLPSAAARPDTVVLQSFSKYFCMTGWRLGWLVLPEHLVRPVERLAQNLFLAPHTLSQHAAIAALGVTDELDALAHRYSFNRRLLTDALRAAGVRDIAPAAGAFYVWADLSRWGTSAELARTWLEDLGVAVTPGTDFDQRSGERHIRFSVAGSEDTITEAAHRLTGWLSTHTEASGTSSERTGDPARASGARS